MFILREYPSTLEECFQSPVEGAIYAELIDKLRGEGAIRPWKVDRSALVHTCWDLGSPINTCVWFFQIVAGEIRVIDIDMDLDLTPIERVSRMLAKGYLYGSHFLPHDAMATQKSGRTFRWNQGNRAPGRSCISRDFASGLSHLRRWRRHLISYSAIPFSTYWRP